MEGGEHVRANERLGVTSPAGSHASLEDGSICAV